MTNSREIAEQAFALLRDALEESESQRLELEDRLKAPESVDPDSEQTLQTIHTELEELRAERDLWKKTSSQLQDVVSNERVKAKRLSKKLDVVESGSDRVTRREVNFWREKAEHFDDTREKFQQRIYELKEELNARNKELDALAGAQVTSDELVRANDLLEARENHIAELNATIEGIRLQKDEIENQVGELNGDYRRRIDEIESQHSREISALRDEHANEVDTLRVAQEEARQQIESQESSNSKEFDTLREQFAELESTLESERREHAEQIEHREAEQRAREAMYESSLTKERADTAEAIRAEFEPRVAALTAQLDEQTNAFAALEADLAEERARSDKLNELANDRRETLTRTTEKLEEMEERYEDARWHLGKARHFESLVRKRRKLAVNLISAIRGKQKATNTLKAGLDSLRRYKASADERQQELLRRVEILESSLQESREQLTQANEARRSSDANASTAAAQADAQAEKVAADIEELASLRKQVSAQTEVIGNLEADIRNARVAKNEAETKLKDVEKLHNDIETKNTFIGTLQKDIEEQQKLRATLRKRDIEARELHKRVEDLGSRLEQLLIENKQLRDAKNGEIGEIDQQKLTDQEQSITKLTARLKEYEATINSLSEAADSWKRKYDFLAADAPYGFESASSSE